jgi:signal transduction histidine kinase
VNQQTVLIIADQNDFARDIVGRWQMERTVPTFTLMGSDMWEVALSAPCDLAILGEVKEGRANSILKAIENRGTSCIGIAQENLSLHSLRSEFPGVLGFRTHEGWVESLVVLGAEVLRRVEAVARARRAESTAHQNMRQAALGRYMLETRHSFNNALTSVLGNAELILLEPGTLPHHLREQVDTIHSMALRLHEMMQRFSSLETEMHFAERESQSDTTDRSQAYISGT